MVSRTQTLQLRAKVGLLCIMYEVNLQSWRYMYRLYTMWLRAKVVSRT